jgi:hypothetical protein
MSKLTNITPENFRCSLGACPAVYTDLTPAEYRCPMGDCPAVLSTEGRYVIIGKRLDPEAEGLSGRVGEDEAAVEIPAEMLLASLGVTELVEAAENALEEIEVGCFLIDTDDEIVALRSIIDRIKGGVNG